MTKLPEMFDRSPLAVATSPRAITVRYSAVDGYRAKPRKFKTVAGASKYATRYVGKHPEMGMTYAVSADGVGKITVEGATLAELFPEES